MNHSTQVRHIRRLLELKESRGHHLGLDSWRNPVDGYVRQNLLDLEIERLFRSRPVFAGLACDVRNTGDYFTLDIAGAPVLVVRGRDGQLRAMLNVCRHRGAPVVSGRGNTPGGFVCPYHGWAYSSNGRLEQWTPRVGFEGLPKQELSLTPLPVAEAHGLVYVRPSPGPPIDLDEILSGVEEELAPFDFANWQFIEERTNIRAMNWKLVVDTFMEQYHLPSLHKKTLASMFEGTLSIYDLFGDNGRLIAARQSIKELESKPTEEWTLLPHSALLWFLFPNIVFIHQQDHVQLWHVYPLDGSPDRSIARVHLYAPRERLNDSFLRHLDVNMELLMRVTNDEDFDLGEKIQRGFHTSAQDSVVFGRNELGLTHYHQTVRHYLGLEPKKASRE